MQGAAHMALERGIDHLMLRHPAFALEGGRRDGGGEMVVVAGQIANLHLGVGERLFDIGFDFGWLSWP